MANVRTIHVDWYNQRPLRFNGGPQLAFQGDHLSNMVVFDNAPELPNYYLLVKMKTDDTGPVDTLPAIMLEGPYWVIPNYYTQICQQIMYQVCCKTESGDYVHHSAEFKGTILPVLKHNGEPIDQSSMFDPYIDILDKKVSELIVAADAMEIDSELKSDSGNPVQNRVIKAALDGLGNDVDTASVRLTQLDTIVGNEATESTAFDFSEEEFSAGAIVNSLNVINVPLTNCTIKTITFVMNTSKALDCMIYVIKSDMTVVKSIEGTSESAGLSHTVSIDYAIPDNETYYVGIYIDTARAITYGPAQEDVQTNCYEFDPSTLIIGGLTKADKRRVRASLLIETAGENKITVLESDVDDLDTRVTALEGGTVETLPAYYDEYLPAKITTLLSLDAEIGSHGDSFVFMTDYHDTSNAGYSPELIKRIVENTATKMIVFGGDIINQYATKEEAYPHYVDFHKRFLFSDAYYPIIGNHEYNDPGNQDASYTGKRMTNSEAYGMNLRQKEVDSRYKWDGGYTYHVDNEAQKIRYYMIGCNPTSTIEAESRNAFFTSLESVPANYTIIVIAHQLAAYNNGNPTYGAAGKLIADGCDAFNARTTFSANGISHNYSTATGKVVLLMQGHTHIDFDLATTGGIPSVCTTCDCYAQQIGSLVRQAGTVTEQAFEVVHVNTGAKTIKLTRIGAGPDREFTYA